MIRIINGTYGRRVGNRIVPTTSADGAFQLEPDKEARLVSRGVAKYVTKNSADENVEESELTDAGSSANSESTSDKKATLEALTRKELDKMAKELGIEKPEKMANKDKVIDAIMNVDDEIIDDGDTPPMFNEEDIA